jgi:hypothetical protein
MSFSQSLRCTSLVGARFIAPASIKMIDNGHDESRPFVISDVTLIGEIPPHPTLSPGGEAAGGEGFDLRHSSSSQVGARFIAPALITMIRHGRDKSRCYVKSGTTPIGWIPPHPTLSPGGEAAGGEGFDLLRAPSAAHAGCVQKALSPDALGRGRGLGEGESSEASITACGRSENAYKRSGVSA